MMSSSGTPSSPVAFPNFICFTTSSTSLSSGSGSVLVNGALLTGRSLSGFGKWSFLSFIELCRALKVVVFNVLINLFVKLLRF